MRTSSSLPFWSALLALLGAVVKQQHVDQHQPGDSRPAAATPVPDATAAAVEQLAYIGCTDREIAARFVIDESVIRQRFWRVLSAARALRCYAIRKAQFDLAREGNGPMLQWLGRNELGQTLNPATPGEAEPDIEAKAG